MFVEKDPSAEETGSSAQDTHAAVSRLADSRQGHGGSMKDLSWPRIPATKDRYSGTSAVAGGADPDDADRLMMQLRAAVEQQEADFAGAADMRRLNDEVLTLHAADTDGWRTASAGKDAQESAAYVSDMGWSRGLEALLQDKDGSAMAPGEVLRKPSAVVGSGAVGLTLSKPSSSATQGAHTSVVTALSTSVVDNAVKREVERLVHAQDVRVRELQARLVAAHEEAAMYRTRALDAENRAAAAETKVAALMAHANTSQPPHTPQTASALRHSDTSSRTTAPLVASAAAAAGIRRGAAAATPAAPAANRGNTQGGDTDKIDVAGKESLVDMLKESHALLISDSHRLHADLEVCACVHVFV